jgi:hypothetical protein
LVLFSQERYQVQNLIPKWGQSYRSPQKFNAENRA